MTDTDRQHFAAILGMLGSDHAGERAAAALKAEAFRKKLGLTWAQAINGRTVYLGSKTVYVDREVVVEVERVVYRWPLLWRFNPNRWAPRSPMDRSVAMIIGAIPLIMFLASWAPEIRRALGY